MTKPAILKTCTFLLRETEEKLKANFEIYDWPEDAAEGRALLAEVGHTIRGIATNSAGPVTEAMLQSLPALEIVSSWSAGREGIDVEAIRRRGIPFSDTSHVLADDVADMAIALLLAVTRRIVAADAYVRSGRWKAARMDYGHRISGLRMGIVGLGQIGRCIARRAEAMGMTVAYAGPNAKPDVPYPHFRSALKLAQWCDVLVLSCPGGLPTYHLVDSTMLAALGSNGWLINVARGTVVDETALIAALRDGQIRGAGLDVFENEPGAPDELIASDRVVLTPHYSSSTLETKALQGAGLYDNLANRLLPKEAPAMPE